jgi:hypothetical protein
VSADGGADGARALEAYLAWLLVNREARARFRADPSGEARRAGLGEEERHAICAVDPDELELAAASAARKRAGQSGRNGRR